MIIKNLRYIVPLIVVALIFSSCNTKNNPPQIEIDIPQSSIPIKEPTNPPINLTNTKYKRPDVLKITENLNSLSNMITVVEGKEQALSYCNEFIRLYTQTSAMRDIIIARFMLDTQNNEYILEMNFWSNYQKEMEYSLHSFSKAIYSSKHSSYLCEMLGNNTISWLALSKSTSEKALENIKCTDIYTQPSLSYYRDGLFLECYNGFITGEISENPISCDILSISKDALSLISQRNQIASQSGYINYFEYILSHRNYTKSQLWTMSRNVREYLSPLTKSATEKYSTDALPIYKDSKSIYKAFSSCTKTSSSILLTMLNHCEDNGFIDISTSKNKAFLPNARYINGTELPFISTPLYYNTTSIPMLSNSIGEGYYLYSTKSKPCENNGWLISAHGKSNVLLDTRFYDILYPATSNSAKYNALYFTLNLTALNTLIYELEEYLYTAENLSVNSISQKFEELYPLYFPQNDNETVKNYAQALTLHQIILSPLSSCDEAIGGIIALSIAELAFNDSSSAIRRFDSLTVADTTVPIKIALEKISVPSPFNAVTVNTSAYFIKELWSKDIPPKDAVAIDNDNSSSNATENSSEENSSKISKKPFSSPIEVAEQVDE